MEKKSLNFKIKIMGKSQFKTNDWSERIIYPKEYGITSYSCLESLVLMMKTSGYRRVDYWHDRFHIKYNLVENIIYSEYYRRLIQKNSIDDIMTLLCEDAPSLKICVDLDLLKTAISIKKADMSDFDIVRLPADATLIVNGVSYHGTAGLKKAMREKTSDVCIRYEAYPCFDDDDYANEDRDYNNYCFCKKDSAKWQEISELRPQDVNFCLIGEHTPKEVLPLVYRDGDNSKLLFASE